MPSGWLITLRKSEQARHGWECGDKGVESSGESSSQARVTNHASPGGQFETLHTRCDSGSQPAWGHARQTQQPGVRRKKRQRWLCWGAMGVHGSGVGTAGVRGVYPAAGAVRLDDRVV